MLVRAAAGFVESTVGFVESEAIPVVKVHTKSFKSAFPVVSVAPVEIVAVYVVLSARFTAGAKVAVAPPSA